MLPSASLGEKYAMYEPIHGSAPDIAGQNKAYPIGSILSLAMMLNLSFGLYHESQAIEKSVNNILSQGFRTSDIATNQKDIISTSDMGDLISSNI